MRNVLVTGGNGQLATCLKELAHTVKEFNFIFTDSNQLDITDTMAVNTYFEKNNISYCINCAAYTAVDVAESDSALAEKVNAVGPRNLANACNGNSAILIHISTDFVFDGNTPTLYTEEAHAAPLSVYGLTKLKGEKAVAEVLKEHFIIRTSWLYSEHGHNFLKTMLTLGKERDKITVVADQIGTPTYAGDLASMLIKIISENHTQYGTYHYSNEGVASWYDFAKAIFEETNIKTKVYPITTENYPTPAKRPKFSVLDKSKTKKVFGKEIPYWRESLKLSIKKLL